MSTSDSFECIPEWFICLLLASWDALVSLIEYITIVFKERALNALNVEKRILAADSQLPSLCYLLSWRLAQGPVLSR